MSPLPSGPSDAPIARSHCASDFTTIARAASPVMMGLVWRVFMRCASEPVGHGVIHRFRQGHCAGGIAVNADGIRRNLDRTAVTGLRRRFVPRPKYPLQPVF